MLAKILNITPNSGFKSSSKSPELMKYIRGNNSAYFSVNDSVDFSPAIQFLARIEWQLKELSKTVNEKLLITFCISNLEFRVVIDLATLNRISFITYEIHRAKTGNINEKVLLVLTSILSDLTYEENDVLIQPNTLNKLFDRFEQLNLTDELSGVDTSTLAYIADDLTSYLQTEFDYINKLLLVFVEKLTGNKLFGGVTQIKNKDAAIIIEKMKFVNA